MRRIFGKPQKGKEQKSEKPELRVVPLHPDSKPQISSLSGRIEKVIDDYIDQEHDYGRMVTYAEIIGTLEILKAKRIP